MKSLVWLLLALSLAGSNLVWAEASNLVRVEVLVFQHVDGQSDRWPMPALSEFAELPDPISRAGEQMSGPPESSQGLAAAAVAAMGPSWPPLYTDYSEHSDLFQAALGRLRSSSDYRVLANLGWIQPLERNARPQPVRVRGQDRLLLPDQPEASPRFVFGRPLGGGSVARNSQYQLDGSLTVRQRQFSHVDLDLVWQALEPPAFSAAPLSPIAAGDEPFLTHRLQTSRPIRLDRLEYFDSPWLGVIVLVQEWSRPDQIGTVNTPEQAP